MEGFILKKKLVGLLLAAAMLVTALAGCGSGDSTSSGSEGGGNNSGAGDTAAESDADAGADYDVENREYKDVSITIHTRWDVGDVSGPLYQAIVEGFM